MTDKKAATEAKLSIAIQGEDMAIVLRLIQQFQSSKKQQFIGLEKQFAQLEHRGILPRPFSFRSDWFARIEPENDQDSNHLCLARDDHQVCAVRNEPQWYGIRSEEERRNCLAKTQVVFLRPAQLDECRV